MKKIILPFLIFSSLIAPCVALFLNFQVHAPFGLIFFIFILFHTILRLWETFLTSREKNRLIIDKDWSLTFVATVYILFFYVIIFEFYGILRQINICIACVGMALYFMAFSLRLWSMRVLGKQWAIHALGETRIQHRRLIKLGPYKYVRHPIYAATVLEQLSVLIVANAYYSLFFFCFVTMPAYFVRMRAEEKNNEKIFGADYRSYKSSTGMFFPRFKKEKILPP